MWWVKYIVCHIFYAVNKLLYFKALKSVLWALNCFSSGQSHWKLEANLWFFACMNSGDRGFLVLCDILLCLTPSSGALMAKDFFYYR